MTPARSVAGRPRTYETEDALVEAIDSYFEWIKGERGAQVGPDGVAEFIRQPENSTITRLAFHIGFVSRQSIYDYEKSGEFSYIIKKARLWIEADYEQRLSTTNPTGAIFALKNMGWRDKVESGFTDTDGKDITWNETRKYIPPTPPTEY